VILPRENARDLDDAPEELRREATCLLVVMAEEMMATFVRQLECLNCSQNRSFVLHREAGQRLISQAEAQGLGRGAVLTCARCGGTSLVSGWTDTAHYATHGIVRRHRAQPAQRKL
jgi:hypothetical protein